MTKQQIIDIFLQDKSVMDVCRKLSPSLYDDLYQELCIVVLQEDGEKLIKAYNEGWFKNYCYKVLHNISRSAQHHSSVMHQISNYALDVEKKKQISEEQSVKMIEVYEKRLNAYIQHNWDKPKNKKSLNKRGRCLDVYWFDVRIVNELRVHKTLRAVANAINIPHDIVYRSLQKVRKELMMVA